MRRAIVLAALLASSAASADTGRTPAWEVSTDWGVSTEEGGETLKAGGLTFRMQKQRKHTSGYFEAGVFPLWAGYYSARFGGILGGSVSSSYSEITDYQNYGTYTKTTVRTYPGRKIPTLIGLGAGLDAYTAEDGSGLIAEGGFAMSGQHLLEIYGAYDLAHGTPGARFNMIYRIGESTFSMGFKFSVQAMFDFDDHPSPIQATLGLTFGPGFRYRDDGSTVASR